MNGYKLTRDWFAFKYENIGVCKASHTDMYLYIVDLWNRLGQKKTFGLPTSITMEVLGIGSYNTYKKTFQDLIDFGFIREVKKSKNQHQSRIIALSIYDKALDKALDKASIKALDKAPDIIIEQDNKEQLNKELLSEIEISDVPKDEIEYVEIAKAYQQLFIKNIKEHGGSYTHQQNAKYKAYVNPIRLMMQNDNVTKEQLQKVWKYLSSPKGNFWKSNILSTKKLREKFSQLIIQSNQSENNGNNKQQTTNAFVESLKRLAVDD